MQTFKTVYNIEQEQTNNFKPGNLFFISDYVVFYNIIVGEFGTLKFSKTLKHLYLLFLERKKSKEDLVTLTFFHHEHGILYHDLELKEETSPEQGKYFFDNLLLMREN